MFQEEDYLTRCVVDTSARRFILYSHQGNEKIVDCERIEEFMSVLEFCRSVLDDETMVYASPLVATTN